MNRRHFILAIGGALPLLPLADAHAQPEMERDHPAGPPREDHPRMPPPRHEERPPPPERVGYHWEPGHWAWRDQWEWIPGHWIR